MDLVDRYGFQLTITFIATTASCAVDLAGNKRHVMFVSRGLVDFGRMEKVKSVHDSAATDNDHIITNNHMKY